MIGQKKWIVRRRVGHIRQVWKIDCTGFDESTVSDSWEATRWRCNTIVDPLVQREAQGYTGLVEREGIAQILTDVAARRSRVDSRPSTVLRAGQ